MSSWSVREDAIGSIEIQTVAYPLRSFLHAAVESLKRKTAGVPKSLASSVNLSDAESKTLYNLLYKILERFEGLKIL